jgi:hypothetical protein
MKSVKFLNDRNSQRYANGVATSSCKSRPKIQQLPFLFLFLIILKYELVRCSQLFVSQVYLGRYLKSRNRRDSGQPLSAGAPMIGHQS